MSARHPIVAVTGSSGAGTTTVTHAFQALFARERVRALIVEGSAFRRYDREGMRQAVREAQARGRPISHFDPEANLFDRLEGLFREYSRTGAGLYRRYVDEESAGRGDAVPGTFSPWREVPADTQLLYYEGLHGGCTEATWSRRELSPSHNPAIIRKRHRAREFPDNGVDIAQFVDLLIGVVPIINLEWIQKIHRECGRKYCSPGEVTRTILRRLPDYVRYITPQFSYTDINFQRVSLVDTSNPFVAREVPLDEESIVVVRFREPGKADFPSLLERIDGSFMSRANTLVIPGRSLRHAIEMVCGPLLQDLMERRARAWAQEHDATRTAVAT